MDLKKQMERNLLDMLTKEDVILYSEYVATYLNEAITTCQEHASQEVERRRQLEGKLQLFFSLGSAINHLHMAGDPLEQKREELCYLYLHCLKEIKKYKKSIAYREVLLERFCMLTDQSFTPKHWGQDTIIFAIQEEQLLNYVTPKEYQALCFPIFLSIPIEEEDKMGFEKEILSLMYEHRLMRKKQGQIKLLLHVERCQDYIRHYIERLPLVDETMLEVREKLIQKICEKFAQEIEVACFQEHLEISGYMIDWMEYVVKQLMQCNILRQYYLKYIREIEKLEIWTKRLYQIEMQLYEWEQIVNVLHTSKNEIEEMAMVLRQQDVEWYHTCVKLAMHEIFEDDLQGTMENEVLYGNISNADMKYTKQVARTTNIRASGKDGIVF